MPSELDPHLAQARTNLGELLLELGLPDEALPHCQAAVALEPGLVEGHLNLGNVLLALGRAPEATASFFRAYQLDERRAQTAASLRTGRRPPRCARRGDRLVPPRGGVGARFGRVPAAPRARRRRACSGSTPEVQSCCERILAIDPDQAVAHNALAWVLHGADRYAEAEEHFRTAIRLQPDFATAHFNLGVLHEDLGDLGEAESLFRHTLRVDTSHATAMARLAALLRGSLPESDLESIRNPARKFRPLAASAGPTSSLPWPSSATDVEQHAEAAACLEQANALALELLARRGRHYDTDAQGRFVDALIAGFTPELFDRLAGSGIETSRPVFIVGLPRSGTTLIEQVLASHPEVHGAGEVAFSRWSLDALAELTGRAGEAVDAVPLLDAKTVGELARRHEQRLFDLDGGQSALAWSARCPRTISTSA